MKTKTTQTPITIQTTKNGPYIVSASVPIIEHFIIPNQQGESVNYAKGQQFTAETQPMKLCRCGNSHNKPFCDGHHCDSDFHGDTIENADIKPTTYQGPNFTLVDTQMYCSFSRFCQTFGKVWNLIKQGTATTDTIAKESVHLCPSGRLTIIDNNTGEIIEPNHKNEIHVLKDPMIALNGPLALKGNFILKNESGHPYPSRPRQTLCRCGKSQNKPFCDGHHCGDKG